MEISQKQYKLSLNLVTLPLSQHLRCGLRPDPIVGFRVHCGCGFTCSGRKFSKATRTLKIRRTCSGTFASGRVPEHFYKIAISVFTEGVALLWIYPKDENSRFESAAGRTLISDEPGEWQHGPSYRSGRAARCRWRLESRVRICVFVRGWKSCRSVAAACSRRFSVLGAFRAHGGPANANSHLHGAHVGWATDWGARRIA